MNYKNQQEYKLFHCPDCGTIFKCLPQCVLNDYAELYHTDYNDIIPAIHLADNKNYWECFKCDTVVDKNCITCEDWVTEKVFSIKGDAPTSKPLS